MARRLKMTPIANPRISDFEEPIVDRPVRLMTVSTIFEDRRVLPQKRPSSLRMTGIAVLVNAVLFQLGRIGAAVRVMTIGADDVTLAERHVR